MHSLKAEKAGVTKPTSAAPCSGATTHSFNGGQNLPGIQPPPKRRWAHRYDLRVVTV